MWRGPDEWLIELPVDQIGTLSAKLEAAFYGRHISVVDITDAFSVIRLSGRGARNVLSSGCSLNLNESEFGVGQCAHSHYCKAAIILNFVDVEPTFDVFVRRSESEYLWQLLQLACQSNA
jgi:sarcosine oxidase subunit gamma